MYNKITVYNVDIYYNNKNIKIKKSYKIKSKTTMAIILSKFKDKTKYISKRTIEDWIKEWKFHNLLYSLHLFRNHTKDCDLQENEKLYRLICYRIFYPIIKRLD